MEVNQLYPGVRVRRLTHYGQEQLEQIVKDMDAIHATVLHAEITTSWYINPSEIVACEATWR